MMTLVETFAFPQPHQIADKETVRATQHVSLPFSLQANIPQQTSLEERYAAQLAYLASQHHLSEYNCLKFGIHGCPIAYVPLSLQMPENIVDLQAAQARHSQDQAWFSVEGPSPDVVLLGPTGTEDVDLQQELSAAIDAPLELENTSPPTSDISQLQNHGQGATYQPVKTSETHPINISVIIPPDVLPIISSHISRAPCSRNSPVMFEIEPSYSLDRITCPPPTPKVSHSFPVPPPLPDVLPLLTYRSTSPVSEALRAAINSGLAAVAKEMQSPGVKDRNFSGFGSNLNATKPKFARGDSKFLLSFCAKDKSTALSAPPSMVNLPHTVNAKATPLTFTRTMTPPRSTPPPGPTPNPTLPARAPSRMSQDAPPFTTAHHCSPTHIPFSPPSSHVPQFKLGNLLLSSCPGKKVRLSGPVKGRSSVRRDLEKDLRRMWEGGVRCVICCLDDNELDFLGAPWPEYLRAAQHIGLDVLRLPTPEGLPPLSVSSLNMHLSIVIHKYTLQGKDVLAHCRGGVGRAGVVACCWILKLGLCGWIETEVCSPVGVVRRAGGNAGRVRAVGAKGTIRRDTVKMVERVVTVVRNRRSIKAVETYEQVKFLVEFVEYLREGGRGDQHEGVIVS